MVKLISNTFSSLSHHFLVAMPQMNDSLFSKSVVYVCEHTENGAMGVIINKPSPIKMEQLFDAVEKPAPKRFHEKWILLGGPIQIDRGFLVHTPIGSWQSSLIVNDDIAITTSRDIISELSMDQSATLKTLATIGYSSWAEGQLEREINENSWIVVPASTDILFDVPYFRRYDEALKSLGINPMHLYGGSAHA